MRPRLVFLHSYLVKKFKVGSGPMKMVPIPSVLNGVLIGSVVKNLTVKAFPNTVAGDPAGSGREALSVHQLRCEASTYRGIGPRLS
ncbi:hypothetical protein J6590_032845 [Homalodisca vitripennis]|nr:hypothetical protein J6590_032845 [Homalodisca vitripennis]